MLGLARHMASALVHAARAGVQNSRAGCGAIANCGRDGLGDATGARSTVHTMGWDACVGAEAGFSLTSRKAPNCAESRWGGSVVIFMNR